MRGGIFIVLDRRLLEQFARTVVPSSLEQGNPGTFSRVNQSKKGFVVD